MMIRDKARVNNTYTVSSKLYNVSALFCSPLCYKKLHQIFGNLSTDNVIKVMKQQRPDILCGFVHLC